MNNSKNIVIPALLIVLSAVSVYFASLSNDLVYCDDNIFVLNNYEKYNVSGAIGRSFTETVGTSYYRPLLQISLILDSQRGGTDPGTFLRTNLILHIASGLLLLIFLLKLEYSRIESTIFTLIFTLHPLLVPAVSWISGRNDSLLAVSFLPAIIFYILSIKSRNGIFYSAFSALFFLSALMTKEIAVAFPVVALSLSWAFWKIKIFSKENIFNIISWLVVFAVWYFLRSSALEGTRSTDEIGIIPFFENIQTIPALFGKFFLPIKMFVLSSFELFTVFAGLIFLGLIIYLVSKNRSEKDYRPFFGLFWFLLLITPSLFVRIANVDDFFDYAEHRIYLPMIGILITTIEILRHRKIDYSKKMVQIIFLLLIITLGIRSFIYSQDFRDRYTFWGKMVETFPKKSRGYLDLGKGYLRQGEYKRAEELYKHGLALNPDNKNLYIDLSILYLKTKNYPGAAQASQMALRLDSLDPIANYNYGKVMYYQGQIKQAIFHFERALNRTNQYPEWFLDLGAAYFSLQDPENALLAFNAAAKLNPSNPDSWSNIGAVYASMGNANEAEKAWLKAIESDNRHFKSYNDLIKLYLNSHDYDKARTTKQKLENLGGDLSPGLSNF